MTSIFEVTAAVLHLGNAELVADSSSFSEVEKSSFRHLETAAKLLKVDPNELARVITSNSEMVRGEAMLTRFRTEKAVNARDALAKGIYGR